MSIDHEHEPPYSCQQYSKTLIFDPQLEDSLL